MAWATNKYKWVYEIKSMWGIETPLKPSIKKLGVLSATAYDLSH